MANELKKGQNVRVYYRESAANNMRLHGRVGRIYNVSTGPGPINALVVFWRPYGATSAIIPMENLVLVDE